MNVRCVKTGKHVLKLTSNTNIRTLRLCVRFKYASFNSVLNRFSRSLGHRFRSFRSLFESISIDYKTLKLNYFGLKFFIICCLFWHPWVALCDPLLPLTSLRFGIIFKMRSFEANLLWEELTAGLQLTLCWIFPADHGNSVIGTKRRRTKRRGNFQSNHCRSQYALG